MEAPQDSTGTIAIITTIAGAVVKIGYDLYLRYRTQSSDHAILATHEVYNILNDLIHNVGAKRCTITYTSNGGGIPSAGNNLYTTVLYEVTNNVESCRDILQGVLADEGYIDMVSTLITEKEFAKPVAKLKEGFIKELKSKEGIDHIQLYYTYKTKKRYYYLTIERSNPVTADKSVVQMQIKTANDKIARIFRQTRTP
jgi:hypothetical protein